MESSKEVHSGAVDSKALHEDLMEALPPEMHAQIQAILKEHGVHGSPASDASMESDEESAPAPAPKGMLK